MANEQRGGSGNFSQDREKAYEAGKKGGQASQVGQHQQGGQRHEQQGDAKSPSRERQQQEHRQGGQQGGAGAGNDPQRASDMGHKGGTR